MGGWSGRIRLRRISDWSAARLVLRRTQFRLPGCGDQPNGRRRVRRRAAGEGRVPSAARRARGVGGEPTRGGPVPSGRRWSVIGRFFPGRSQRGTGTSGPGTGPALSDGPSQSRTPRRSVGSASPPESVAGSQSAVDALSDLSCGPNPAAFHHGAAQSARVHKLLRNLFRALRQERVIFRDPTRGLIFGGIPRRAVRRSATRTSLSFRRLRVTAGFRAPYSEIGPCQLYAAPSPATVTAATSPAIAAD